MPEPSRKSTRITATPIASTFALHDAQLVLARSYGFDSWPKLKAYVDGVTVKRLADAVRSDDVPQVSSDAPGAA